MNKFFKNIDHALSFAEKGLSESIHVKTLITAADYVSWQKKLVKEADFESYLLRGKYNLLILAVAAGIDKDPAIVSLNNFHASKLMAALDSYLNLFPFLLKNKKFISKLKNLDGLIATICELSLAKYFHSAGYKVSFETPFQNMTSSTTKDVDLSVTDKLGNTIHFEIYMPVHAIEMEGFFAPEEEDHHFEYKVMKNWMINLVVQEYRVYLEKYFWLSILITMMIYGPEDCYWAETMNCL